MPRSTLLASAAVLIAAAGAATAQGLPPIQKEFANGATLRFYGQIDKGILGYDDGKEEQTYYIIDNNNSNTRFGLLYSQDFTDWKFENVNEFQYAPYSTANINIIDDSPSSSAYDWSNSNIRKIDFTLDHDRYGKFWLGQGSMATDGIAEIDLSGTGVIAYSSVADSAAAQIIRYSDPDLFFADNPQNKDVFDNFDGARLTRIRYDTPAFAGFSAAFAFGRNLLSSDEDVRDIDQYDVGLRYSNEFNAFNLQAGLGYFANDDDLSTWAGSVSALHTPTGINGTLAAGTADQNDNSGSYWYGKLGLLRDFVSWGATAASIDYYTGDDIFLSSDVFLFDSDNDPVLADDGSQISGDITSSTSDSWGIALVQSIDRANTELWLTYRSYDYSNNFASYEDGQAIFGGARFKF